MERKIVKNIYRVGLQFLPLLFPALILAQGFISIDNPSSFNSLEDIINTLLGWVRPIIVLVLVGTLMYGGWVYLNAREDDAKVASAQKIITAAVVGFIIIVLAPSIAQLAATLFGIRDGIFNFNQP